MKYKVNLEDGAASLFIDLSKGKIIVKHGTDKVILYKSKVKKGYWDNLWNAIKSMGVK